jgi:cytosine/creatinine deaminase
MDTVVRNARLRGREDTVDIAIEGDRIAAVEPSIDGDAGQELDAAGNLVIPGLVDAHIHLDKCMLNDVMRTNVSQTFRESIEITNEHKRAYTVDDILSRAGSVVETAIANGTTAMRVFADVGTIGGLTPIEGIIELRRRYEGQIHLEAVAFPQEGLPRDPGADRLMEEAMELGADVVGGIPWYEVTDAYMRDHVDFCFELAKKTGKDIHMLADDTDDAYSRSLEYLAVRTIEEGYQGRVTASHCRALAAYDHAHAQKVMGLLRDADITVSANAMVTLAFHGGNDRGLIRRGLTRVRELLEEGVNVITSQDDVNDPYYPFGKADQLQVAQYIAHGARLVLPQELETVMDMVTTRAARALRLEGYGLEPGDRADLVCTGAPTVNAALRLTPPRPFVVYGGQLVAESRLDVTRHGAPAAAA